jgi:hypothetical protein
MVSAADTRRRYTGFERHDWFCRLPPEEDAVQAPSIVAVMLALRGRPSLSRPAPVERARVVVEPVREEVKNPADASIVSAAVSAITEEARKEAAGVSIMSAGGRQLPFAHAYRRMSC